MSFKHRLSYFSNNSNTNAQKKEESQSKNNNSNNPILSKSSNEKSKLQIFRKTVSNVVRLSKVLNKNQNYSALELEGFNTIEKIIKLQEDLKIVASIKQQFEGNQKKMIEKMNKFCLNYYKNKINMKKIFDYCSDANPENNYVYNLLTTEQAKDVLKDKYNDVFEFIFLLRNDNNLMLKILDNCNSDGYPDISDFLVNFCYEDTINSSFIQEDMLLLIYLLIEKCIIKIMPKFEELKDQNNKNIYGDYFKNNILYYIFLSLTRKADIRSYLCSILPEIILKVENLRSPLTVEISLINIYLSNLDERKKMLAESRNATLKPNQYTGKSGYLKRLSAASTFYENKNSKLKLTNRLTLQNLEFPENFFEKEETNENSRESKRTLNKSVFSNKNTKTNYSDKNLDNLGLEDLRNETGCDINIVEVEENEKDNSESDDDEQNIDIIDPLFISTETTLEYVEKKIKEYEGYNHDDIDNLSFFNKNTITAMKDYLNHLAEDIKSEGEGIEKYSNMILINSLNSSKNIKNNENFTIIVDTIKNNHQIIIETITELLSIIKDNIQGLPFFIKCISKSIDILLDYKYKNNLSLYSRYMIKANFLLGNIILPVFACPSYNGIITNEIISNITKDNLEIIASILNMMLTGKLFSFGAEPFMTIFNQFIIEILPIVFEIVQNIDQNVKLPNLINGLTETINDIDKEDRNINYDYFTENSDEKFHFQSICFSYTNMKNLFNGIIKFKIDYSNNKGENDINENKEKNIRKEKEKTNEEIEKIRKKAYINEILEKHLNNQNFLNLIFNLRKSNTEEFIYITKIDFWPSFENKIKSILKDNFIGLNPPIKEKFKEEEVSRFKKCLAETLTYANLIHKEYIPNFMHVKKDNYIHNQDLIDLIVKNKAKEKYDNIINDDIYENTINEKENNTINEEENIDPNFKTEILPYILLNVKNELGSNSTDNFYQKMLYCCSYLQLHINLLPPEYILDNYKLLFTELIKDTESNIHILRNNILNQLNIKVKGSEKTNMIISNTFKQIKNMEKLKCIEHLYSNLTIPTKFKPKYPMNGGAIIDVTYEEETKAKMHLNSLFESIPDYRKYESSVDDIIELEEKTNMGKALKNYFKNLKNLIRKEKIVKKYSKEETENICNDLENYLLVKLYDKLFPLKNSKADIKFYKKCCRLDFIKPENIIKDKNIINENLWKTSMNYINEMDKKFTPVDKIKCFAKAFAVLQNSISFYTGKKDLGVDDTIKPLTYVLLKSKPKYIFSNYNYCQLYLDPDLSKKQHGILLTQICMIMNIIKDMKYSELIDVTEEQFGVDEE